MSRIQAWAMPSATLIAALILASVGALIGRYQIAATGTDSDVALRLDRWTGRIEQCRINPKADRDHAAPIYFCYSTIGGFTDQLTH